MRAMVSTLLIKTICHHCLQRIQLHGVRGLVSTSKFDKAPLEWYEEKPKYAKYCREIPNTRLNKIFSEISSGGCFAVGGVASFTCLPGLKIGGIGDISLPLSPAQADLIKTVGTQAPYGKGSETLVDKAVRDTIQVSPSQVTFGPRWASMLDDLARTACEGMGIQHGNFRVELYKLLLYQRGGHFKPHQDTEKSVGMFGTLVVQFPSSFTGGSSVIRHSNLKLTFRMGGDDGSCSTEYHHVAHYADCEHEVKEITDGNRLVAVYSLIWADDSPPPSAPDTATTSRLAKYLKKLMHNRTLSYMLTHQYTPQSLSNFGLRALKRRDRTIAGALLAASAMMSAGSPGDELVINVVRLSQSNLRCEDIRWQVDLEEVYDADGTCWPPGPGQKQHLKRVDFSSDRDTVNFSPTEKIMSDCGEIEECGFFHHHHKGYIGNEGDAEESIYSRYALTFCRREAVDACQPGDQDLAELEEYFRKKQETMDEEEQTKQRNTDRDARGIAKFGRAP